MIYKFGWFTKCFVKAKQLATNDKLNVTDVFLRITLGYVIDDKCKGSTD